MALVGFLVSEHLTSLQLNWSRGPRVLKNFDCVWQQWSCCAPYVWLSSADTGYELADWAEFNPSLFADILSNIMSGQFVAITRRGFRIYSFKTSFSVLSPLKDWDNFIVVFGRTNCAKSLLCLINFTALCITLCIVLRPQLELGDLVLICFLFFANCSFFITALKRTESSKQT